MAFISKLRLIILYVLLLAAKPLYGGQAVLNGVMMKGKTGYAIAVNSSTGIQKKFFNFSSITKKYKILNIPIIRGIVILIEMMKVGNKSLSYSADIVIEDAYEPSERKGENGSEHKEEMSGEKITKSQKSAFSFMMVIAVLVSTVFAIGLFKVAPLGAATLLNNYISIPTYLFNIVAGLTKLAIFVLYIFLVSQYKDIKELFTYHGAEHKTIHCYESGQPLKAANISLFSRIHPRCGTAFIFVVILFTILITLFISKEIPFWTSLIIRISLLPIIIGASYEFQRLSARTGLWIFKIFMAPGLWLQRLTTNNPSPEHISTARVALRAVLLADAKKNAKLAKN